KKDKDATDTVETEYRTQGKVGNYTKKLLPGAIELKEVERLAGSLRKFFYEQTLPWYSDGSRILSSKNYIDFTREFAKRKGEFDGAVQTFIQNYPDLRERAKQTLGNLFRETEYPTVAKLQNSFACDIS